MIFYINESEQVLVNQSIMYTVAIIYTKTKKVVYTEVDGSIRNTYETNYISFCVIEDTYTVFTRFGTYEFDARNVTVA